MLFQLVKVRFNEVMFCAYLVELLDRGAVHDHHVTMLNAELQDGLLVACLAGRSKESGTGLGAEAHGGAATEGKTCDRRSNSLLSVIMVL